MAEGCDRTRRRILAPIEVWRSRTAGQRRLINLSSWGGGAGANFAAETGTLGLYLKLANSYKGFSLLGT